MPPSRRSRPRVPALLAAAVLAAVAGIAEARLDPVVAPTAQTVTLRVDPAQADFTGSVRIELAASAAADSFQLHARALRIASLTLASPSGPVEATWNAAEHERITVHPARPLAAGAYTLDIAFAGTFDRQATGLYRLRAGDDWYAFTQFEADEARQAFPCWDEPSFKIPWQIVLEVPSNVSAYSNMPAERADMHGGYVRMTYRRSRPMPSYLVALAVGPLEAVEIPGMSTPGRVVTVKGQVGRAGEAVRMAPRILEALEDYFRRPYPYEKLDLVAVPEFLHGAMENAGLITFADGTLLIDPETGSVQQRRRLAAILAHEMAHQWFGDLVTMEWWDDLWLNESFASWLGDKVAERAFPEFEIAIGQVEDRGRALVTDELPSARAIRQPLDETANLGQMADALAYDKGQAVLEMFERWIGEETFRQGIVDYTNAFAWKNARAADLWAALSRAAKRDLAPAMSTYLDRPGVPVVSAEVLPGGRLRLRQRRSLPHGFETPAQLWQVPVALRFSDGTRIHTQRVMLTTAEQTVALTAKVAVKWLHLNADERGYYRWSVPAAMLREMAGASRSSLTPRERIGFVGNLAALLEAGDLAGDEYLRLLAGFGDDAEPEVVEAVLKAIARIRTVFVGPDLEPAFARYVRNTVGPALERIGRERRAGESAAVSALRARLLEVLGDEGGDAAAREDGRRLARAFLADAKSVDPALVETALQLSALEGDAALFEEYRARFESAAIPGDRQRFLRALGHFRDPDLVGRVLEYGAAGPLRPRETTLLFEGFDTPALRDRLWEWVRANYDRFIARVAPVRRVGVTNYAFGCSRERIEAARTFFADLDTPPRGTDQELAKVVNRIEQCVSLRDREGARVAKALAEMAAAN